MKKQKTPARGKSRAADYRPQYRAEAEVLAAQVELDRVREAMRVLERCGLKVGDEHKRLNAAANDIVMRIDGLYGDVKRQHHECGKDLCAAFVAIDLLNELLDRMADTFERNCLPSARSTGLDFVAGCRALARECNHQVCTFAANDRLDQAFADTSEAIMDRVLPIIDEVIERNEFKLLRN